MCYSLLLTALVLVLLNNGIKLRLTCPAFTSLDCRLIPDFLMASLAEPPGPAPTITKPQGDITSQGSPLHFLGRLSNKEAHRVGRDLEVLGVDGDLTVLLPPGGLLHGQQQQLQFDKTQPGEQRGVSGGT